MRKIIIPIRGMHCKSCEILVEQNLKKISGVNKVKASYRQGQAEVSYAGKEPSAKIINQAVIAAGYEVGNKEKLPWLSTNPADYKNLAKAAGILLVLYLLAKWFGLFGLNIGSSNGGLFIALLVGLVAGVSTCMALVGGLVLGLASRHAELHPEATPLEKFRPHLYFNLGRVVGFGLLGGLIGLIGLAIKPSGNILGLMTIVVGGVMIFLGLKLVEIFPALRDQTIALPTAVAKIFGLHKENREYSDKGAAILGGLTFFLPCGFTQAMQLLAVSTGSFWGGALVMSLFAVGTAPGLLGIGGLTSVFKGQKARVFYMIAGLAVIAFGLFNITNGSRLISFAQTSDNQIISSSTGQVQEARMTQLADGYEPNVLTVAKGRPVKWIITGAAPYSCSSEILMPKFKIIKSLKQGENIIEFTPTATGEIPFSCSMGMYRGKFVVVDDVSSTASAVVASSSTPANSLSQSCSVTGGGSSCGCGGGAAPVVSQNGAAPVDPTSGVNEQVLKAVFTLKQDIQPNTFTVKKGLPVRLEVEVKDNGQGCMSSIEIPGLYDQPQYLAAGQTIIMQFTPETEGDYLITCAMGVPRGNIKVVS